jgi:group I intron endonuclease
MILEFIISVFSIPLASLYLSTIFPSGRFAFLISLNIVIYYHIIDGAILSSVLSSGLGILGGLFQTTLLSQSLEIFILGNYSYMEQSNLLLSLIPIVTYPNADTDRSQILSDNKGKAGIYMWTHIESGKSYVGSAFDITKRLRAYYSIEYLERNKSMYICNALFHQGYSAFTLSILEFIDISGLSKEGSRELILSREQCYLDLIFEADKLNTYNLLKIAGSSLGYKHTEESLAKISGVNSPFFSRTGLDHPNYGKTHSAETKALLSKVNKGKTLSASTKALISEAKTGKTPSLETRVLMSQARKGKSPSAETRDKISKTRGTTIYVYSSDKFTLVNIFVSANKAGEFFNCSPTTIKKYVITDQLFKGKWKLTTSLICKK